MDYDTKTYIANEDIDEPEDDVDGDEEKLLNEDDETEEEEF